MTIKNNSILGNKKEAHNNKIIFFFVLIAIIIIIFGFKYLKQSLYNPFLVEIPEALQRQLDKELEDNKQVSIAELKDKDTDHDGLTDYQELYQYRTSIFLEDTDSDGYTDYEEVNSGQEPLCPRGENCNLLSLITPSSKLSEVVGDVISDPNLTILQATLNEFRQFLLDNNISEEDVNSLTDDDLLTLLLAINESGLNSNTNIEDLGAEEIRSFLLSQPQANVEEINSLTEEELLEIRDKLIQK